MTRTSNGPVLVYKANNSGGDWWLRDDDWNNLAEAGWNVFWSGEGLIPSRNGGPSPYSDDPEELLTPVVDGGHRWLGTRATACAKRVESSRAGIAEWEAITGQHASDIGCNCCGPPHSFRLVRDGESAFVEFTQARAGSLSFPDEDYS